MASADPWNNHYFSLEIDGEEIAHFLEFSGLKSSAEVFEIQEGGNNGFVHKRPGISRFDPLTLRYATSASTRLLEWRDSYLQDKFTARPKTGGSIVLRDLDGAELRRYTFGQLWPVSWEGSSLQSGGSALGIESLQLAYDDLKLDVREITIPDPPPPPEEPKVVVGDDKIQTPPIQFEYDSDELTPEGEKTCEEVSKALKEAEVERVWIEGHTCTLGSWAYNLSLSGRRALTVKRKLTKDNPDIVYFSAGYSYKYPVASNQTEATRESNRRVDFFQSSYSDRGRSLDKPSNKPK